MTTRTENKNTLISRDLSWLAFNYRVLQEARDPQVPLLERLKFLAIFSANLDEFFKVRVATLRRLMRLKKKTQSKVLRSPSQELNRVLREVTRQQTEFGEIFRDELLPGLREAGIDLVNHLELSAEQLKFATGYFSETLKPLLRTTFVPEDSHHLFLKDQTVFMVVQLVKRPAGADARAGYALIEVPTQKHKSRFLELPCAKGRHCVIFIDDLMRLGLPLLFPHHRVVSANTVKISRDAELDLEEDISGDLLARVRRSIRKREKGFPARLLIDPGMPVKVLELLKKKTGVSDNEVISGSHYHNFRDFFGFPDFGMKELTYPPQPPLPHPAFQPGESIFETVSRQKVLLHYPYHQYDYVIRFFEEAAADPDVSAISVTLYRVAQRSKIAKALVKAARNGKLVTVMVELKARFDEESNITWARKLEKAGVYVIYGVPDYKVHAKVALVTRQEKTTTVNYTYLSTGNFNENTALVYTDYGYFTKSPQVARELDQVFQYFTDRIPDPDFEKLLVAPFTLRRKLERLINREINKAEKGQPAAILLKLNSLEDERMVRKLYQASQAGVQIDLIIRGICTLIPGRKKLSENIRLRSIVDRYLEHTRVYVFGTGPKARMYIASADWMTRNLSRRVEIAFPLTDPELKQQVFQELELQLADNQKARTFDNEYLTDEAPPVQSQVATYALWQEKQPSGPA